MTLNNSPGERPHDRSRERPIGVLIRRRRRILGWSIEKLTAKYLINLGRQDRYTDDDLPDLDEHPLAIREADIGRLERGESVRITLAKLRLLCQTLMFSQEETVRILARAQGETTLIDLDDEMARVLEALYLAATALIENPTSKLSISQQLGERLVDDVPPNEVLSMVHAAIEEVLAPRWSRILHDSSLHKKAITAAPVQPKATLGLRSPDQEASAQEQPPMSEPAMGSEGPDKEESNQDGSETARGSC